jgi:hypothetical protein
MRIASRFRSRIHNGFVAYLKAFIVGDRKVKPQKQFPNTEEDGGMIDAIFHLFVIALGALGGSSASLFFGLTGGIIGAVVCAISFAVMSYAVDEGRRERRNHKTNRKM